MNVDNFWLLMDNPTNLMTISALLEFDDVLSYDDLCDTLINRLLCIDRFRKRVEKTSGVGLSVWQTDDTFTIHSHVHRIALPKPGNKKVLQEIIGDLIATPLDRSKPLWQIHLIENYNGGSALFGRFHQCIADGMALIRVFLSITDDKPNMNILNKKDYPKFISPKSIFTPKKNPITHFFQKTTTIFQEVKKEAITTLANPFHMVEIARTNVSLTIDYALALGKLAIMRPDPKTSLKGDLSVRKHLSWTDPIPLMSIKNIAWHLRVKLNDVLFGIVTGGLRRYLRKRNDRVKEIEVRVAIPVDIRRPWEKYELGNKQSIIFFSLPIHIEDPVARVREINQRMQEIKESPDAIIGFNALNTLGISLSNIAHKGASFISTKSTAVLNNVPGPTQPIYLAGKQLRNMMFWVPRIGSIGHNISIVSYNGNVTIGLTTDSCIIPDPSFLLDSFMIELSIYLKMIQSETFQKETLPHADIRNDNDNDKSMNHNYIFYSSLADTRMQDEQPEDIE